MSLIAVPREFTAEHLARQLGFRDARHLNASLARIAEHGYRPFPLQIGGKRRVISAPKDWLKRIQRRAYDEVILRIPCSEHVYNRPGKGVIANAERHLGSAYMAVFDVKDCFPSTTMRVIRGAFEREGLQPDVAGALTRLTTRRGCLPHGPPTSPGVLDIVFRSIDEMLADLASRYGAIFTRYMDDLSFSGPEDLSGLRKEVGSVLSAHQYSVNLDKVRVWGPEDRHTVTKIVVSTSLNAQPEFIEALSRELALVRSGKQQLSAAQLRGKIAWVKALNPKLGAQLERRLNKVRTVARDGGRRDDRP